MMPLNNASPAFEQRYASHLKHLKLQGLQTKTVDAYARAIRTMGEHFDWQIDTLSADQLTDYFAQRGRGPRGRGPGLQNCISNAQHASGNTTNSIARHAGL